MKKRCYLPLIVLLIFSLNSCALFKGKVGVGDAGLIFNDQTYSISSEEFSEYNFYVYVDDEEKITEVTPLLIYNCDGMHKQKTTPKISALFLFQIITERLLP